MSLIQIVDCKKRYPGVELVYPNLAIGDTNILLVGQNGSGKSTLLYMMMGWVSYTGSIDINGTLSIMIERPMFPRDVTVKTVLDHLAASLDETLIKQFQLEDKLDQMISSLSKGMKAKLNLLQCIGIERDLYLFDEPTSGLDKDAILNFIGWLEETKKRWIVSTHQPDLFAHLSCEVIRLDSSS